MHSATRFVMIGSQVELLANEPNPATGWLLCNPEIQAHFFHLPYFWRCLLDRHKKVCSKYFKTATLYQLQTRHILLVVSCAELSLVAFLLASLVSHTSTSASQL